MFVLACRSSLTTLSPCCLILLPGCLSHTNPWAVYKNTITAHSIPVPLFPCRCYFSRPLPLCRCPGWLPGDSPLLASWLHSAEHRRQLNTPACGSSEASNGGLLFGFVLFLCVCVIVVVVCTQVALSPSLVLCS